MSRKSLNVGSSAAKEFSQLLLRHAAECNEFLAIRQPVLPKEEFDALKVLVGRIMGEIYVQGLYPIFDSYPDLKPHGLD
jgi:hypothetical protein